MQESPRMLMNGLSVTVALLAFVLAAFSQAHSGQVPLGGHGTPIKLESIPLLGFGTWNLNVNAQNTSDAVSAALQTGYRHIDAAKIYGNQKDVGNGIADGLKKAGLARDDIWITSKLWNDHHDPDRVPEGLETTLSELNLDYLDLYLMHWPVASDSGTTYESYVNTWKAMTKLLATGKVRYIGVSNFDPEQLTDLIKSTNHRPSVHQFEMHPYLQQTDWLEWHEENGIHVTQYSPLANVNPIYKGKDSSKKAPPALLDNVELQGIAEKRNCTVPQVALKWGISRGASVIPKSSHVSYIEENYGALECRLEDEDSKAIAKVGKRYLHRYNNPSKSYGVPLFKGLDGV
ncbi:MAG: hypothetical protein M1821_006976 [Bathelium mastoideum]|nr:MAG: hypothetical protein M1821_006976 [Bathelium mastoideum]KAI9683511.1 MAG: hypothetical protein M1822_006051 [Bathelium mastoideum]